MRYEIDGKQFIRFGKEFLQMPVKLYKELKELMEYILRYWLSEEFFKERFPTILSFFKDEISDKK